MLQKRIGGGGEHIEQVLFVFPVDTLRLKAGMVVKTVVDRKNVNEKQLLQEVDLQSVSLSDMSAKTEIHKTELRKLLIGQPEVGIGMELFCWF